MSRKLIVFGFDGATFNILLPLIKKGKLPNIARLIKNGVYGTLESSIPSVTFLAWKCYSTGKNPALLKYIIFSRLSIKNKIKGFMLLLKKILKQKKSGII